MTLKMIAKEFINEELGFELTSYIDKKQNIFFIGKDVAQLLGYKDTNQAIRKHVDQEDKFKGPVKTTGGLQQTFYINESGFYSLVLSSKLDTAKKFKHWVTSEVLPSIRKFGFYKRLDLRIKQRVIIDGKKYYKHPVFTNYAVSKNGIICNVKNERPRKMCTNNSGYQVFTMYNKQLAKIISYTQHRFVYEVFNGPVTKFFEIDHINNDRKDNRLKNLQLLTRKENIRKKNF